MENDSSVEGEHTNKRNEFISKFEIQKWQSIVNLLANIINVPAALIMKVVHPYIEVFRASDNKNNPYNVGEREKLQGFYCETVIKTGKMFLVPNALTDKKWEKNPDIKYGMISYLGLPLIWPDGEVFGTICVLDQKENKYNKDHIELLKQFKELIESYLEVIYEKMNLEEEIAKQAKLVENISEAIISTDLDFKIISWNNAAEKIYGWEAEEVIGKNIMDTITIEYPHDDQETALKLFSEEGFWRGEIIQPHKNGASINILTSLSIIKDVKGEPIRTVAINRNNTERKRAEQKLKESEEILRATLDSTEDGILVVGEKGQITHINSKFGDMWRIPQDLIVERDNQKLLDYVSNQLKDPKAFLSKINHLQRAKSEDFDTIYFKDGRIFERFSSPLVIDDKIKARVLSFRNITERKRAEQELLEEKGFTEMAINSQRDTFFIFEPTTGKAIRWNKSFREISGFSDVEIASMKAPNSYYNEDDLKRAVEATETIKKEGQAIVEMNLITKNGRSIPFEYLGSTIVNEEGSIKYIVSIGRDITDRKKDEQILKESEEKHRQLVENIPDAIYSTLPDETGTTTFMSNKWHTWTGFAPEDFYKDHETWQKSMHPDDRESTLKKFIEMWKQKKEYILEYRVIHNETGEVYFLKDHGAPVYDDKGNLLRYDGIVTDISKQKVAEQKLTESEQRLKSFMDSATDGFVLIDSKLNYIDANKVTLQTVGMTKEELIGKNILDIAPNLKETGRYDEYLDVLKTGEPFSTEEVTFNRLDGSLNSYFSLRTFKVGDNLGVVFTDITERKKSENNFKQIRDRLVRLTDNADEAIFRVEAKGGQVIYVNPAAERLFGYTKAEWISNPHLGAQIILPDFVERQKEIIEELNKNRKPIKNAILGWKAKDGREVIMEYSIIPIIDDNGQLTYFESIGRDITERKKSEEALKESERRLKEAQALGKIGYWEFDITKQQITWSDQVFELYNRDPSLGPPSVEEEAIYYTPDTNERLKEYTRRALEYGEEYDYDFEANLPSGKVVQLTALMRSIKNKSGQIIKLVGTVQDITERKQAEEKLKESEMSLRKSQQELKLKNQISNVLLTFPDENMFGKVLLIILKTLKSEFGIFGYLDEDENLVEPSLTKEVWEKCAIEDKIKVFPKKLWSKNIYGRVINEKKSLFVNKSFNVPDGHIPISNFLGTPIIYNDKVIGIFIVANKESDYVEYDVKQFESISNLIAPILSTRLERDRIEEKRKKAEKRILNLAKFPSEDPNPVLRVSKDIIIYVNQASQELFNIHQGDIIPEILRESVKIVLKKSTAREIEFKTDSRVISLIITPIKDQDYVNIYGRDITDRKKVEEKNREAYERENFYKNLFAHDIRNILQSVSSAEQVFSLFLHNPEKSQEKEKLLEIIRKQVIRGNILISNVQKLSQLEEIGITLKKVKIQDVLDESIEFIDKSFPEKEIDVTIDISDKEYIVFANELLLDAFENIMNNSIKHNDNPIVKIDIRVSEDQWEERECIKLEFIDNGRGIPAAKKEIIFQKGHQKDITSKGMGIGLSLVKMIIEHFNGHILVEDKVKGDYTKGSRFIIYIPEAL